MTQIEMKLNGKRLNEMCKNLQLYTPAKASICGAKAFFSINNTYLSVVAFDDYVIMRDRWACHSSAHLYAQFALKLADIKALELKTRELGEELLDLTLDGDILKVLDLEIETVYPDEHWGAITELVENDWDHLMAELDAYINPDRLSKLSRLKAPGDHPLGFRFSLHDGKVVVPFIYGETVKGLIVSMDEETLKARGVAMFTDGQTDRSPGFGDREAKEEIEEPPPWDEDDPDCHHDHDGDLFEKQGPCEPRHDESQFGVAESVVAKYSKTSAIGYRAEYDTPMQTEAPDHCDKEAHDEFGF